MSGLRRHDDLVPSETVRDAAIHVTPPSIYSLAEAVQRSLTHVPPTPTDLAGDGSVRPHTPRFNTAHALIYRHAALLAWRLWSSVGPDDDNAPVQPAR